MGMGMAQTTAMGMGMGMGMRMGSAAAVGGGAFQNSASTMGSGYYQDGRVDMAYRTGRELAGQQQGSGFYSEFDAREEAYNDSALPDHILNDYYSQVS